MKTTDSHTGVLFGLLLISLVLSALGTPVLKALVEQGGHLGITKVNALSYCNIFFVGNLCSALLVLVYFHPGRLLQQAKKISRNGWKSLLGNVLYACVVSPILIVMALEDAGDITTVIILLQTNAAFFALFAWLLDGEKVTRQCMLGLCVLFFGVLTLMFFSGAEPIGWIHACSIGAAACNALGSCLSRKPLADPDVLPPFLLIRNLLGAMVFFWLAISMFELHHFADAFSPGLWPLMLVYAALVVLLGQLTWYKSVSGLSSETVATWSTIVPALSLFFAWLLLGSVPLPMQWYGIVIVVSGLAISKVQLKQINTCSDATPKSIAQRPLTGA